MLVFRILGEHTKLQLIIVPLFFQLCKAGYLLIAQIHIGAGFVQQVNGLIGQETVGNIPLGENDALPGDLGRDGHAVEIAIGLGNPLHNLASFLDGRLCYRNRLEATLQGRILFNMLAVFIKSGCANYLNFATGKGRL